MLTYLTASQLDQQFLLTVICAYVFNGVLTGSALFVYDPYTGSRPKKGENAILNASDHTTPLLMHRHDVNTALIQLECPLLLIIVISLGSTFKDAYKDQRK